MISLDEIRSALETAVPTTEIDKFIRRELAKFRTTREIYEELISYLPRIREWPIYDEEREENYEGMLDRLTGMCHRDCHYHSIPKPDNVLALEGTAETISRLLAPLPPHDQLLVLNRAKDLVTSRSKIPA